MTSEVSHVAGDDVGHAVERDGEPPHLAVVAAADAAVEVAPLEGGHGLGDGPEPTSEQGEGAEAEGDGAEQDQGEPGKRPPRRRAGGQRAQEGVFPLAAQHDVEDEGPPVGLERGGGERRRPPGPMRVVAEDRQRAAAQEAADRLQPDRPLRRGVARVVDFYQAALAQQIHPDPRTDLGDAPRFSLEPRGVRARVDGRPEPGDEPGGQGAVAPLVRLRRVLHQHPPAQEAQRDPRREQEHHVDPPPPRHRSSPKTASSG